MVKRSNPTCRCFKCGRTVAIKDKTTADEIKKYDMLSVVPEALRPHKCSHGIWCDECRESHERAH